MSYAYQKPSGEVVWRHWKPSEFVALGCPSKIEVDGVTARRSYRIEQTGMPPTRGWPQECWASGVNANQADELRKEFERLKIPTEVTPDGNPVYTSKAHRDKALKARGFFDRASYY